jgi:hypothetical protein
MSKVRRSPWPHWTSFSPNTHEFIDPAGDHRIRVVCFERLHPGGEGTIMSAGYVPSHANSYDVLFANLQLPLPDAGRDPVDPIDGILAMRPESLFTQGRSAMPAQPPATDHIQVNIYLHVEGPSGEPLITLPELAAMVAKLEREQPDRVRADKGEYVAADGTVHELLEVCWERRMGRKFRYPKPPRLNVPLVLPVNAYAWSASAVDSGVHIKPFLSISAGGPVIKLVKLDKGAKFATTRLDKHRFIAVLAGAVNDRGKSLSDLSVLYGPPGEMFGTLVAEQPTLLWVVDWQPKNGALASCWES